MTEGQQAICEQRVGTVLAGKWTLERLLGLGGMAAVYAARHRIGSEVAIKLLHPELARSAELRMRFEREARVANQLRHPGAVEVRDVDVTADGLPFMVMELLQGEPLGDRFRRQGVQPDEMLRFVDELLDVLAAAHAQGIVHRDVKLDNLFITEAGSLKVLDFGIARVREGIAMTMHGAMLGTLPYMPPEQARGHAIDGRADLFAVGAVMFRLMTGRRVHEAATEPELVAKMTSVPAPSLQTVASQAPTGLVLVIDRALAFERDQRYPDAGSMRADVQALRRGEPPPHASRMLADKGPPNATAAADEVATSAAAATVPTRAATPFAGREQVVGAAAVVVGASGPASAATVAAGPQGAAASAGASGPASAPTVAAPAAGPPAGAPGGGGKTEVLPSAAAQVAAHTKISAPTPPPPSEATKLSAGVAAAVSAPVAGATFPAGAAPASAAGYAAARAPERSRRRWLIAVAVFGMAALVLLPLLLWRCGESQTDELGAAGGDAIAGAVLDPIDEVGGGPAASASAVGSRGVTVESRPPLRLAMPPRFKARGVPPAVPPHATAGSTAGSPPPADRPPPPAATSTRKGKGGGKKGDHGKKKKDEHHKGHGHDDDD